MQELLAPGIEIHAALRAARELGPIATEPNSGATVVLRHRDVEALARDHRLAGVGLTFFDLMGITSGPLREWYGSLMFTNEGDTHDRLRSLVARAFTPRSVEALREQTLQMFDDAIASVIDGGGGDLVEAFDLLPMRVMCRLLGVPEADVVTFGAWADALSPVFGFMDPVQIASATDSLAQLLAYVGDLADRRRAEPGEDLITALLAAEADGDRLTHDELITMVANLLVGGHDTTASQLGCSALTLLTYPDQAAIVRDEPGLVQSATEETIRFEPSIPAVPRTVVETVEVAGTELGSGSLVLLCTAAANREPETWERADDFDVRRFSGKGGPRLLSFGAGPHFCLGAALARMTVQAAVATVAEAADRLALSNAPEEIEWRVVLGRSPRELRVTVAD